MQNIMADVAVSVSELKKNPSSVLDDLELVQVVKARLDAQEAPVRVALDDLIGEAEADIVNGH
jgi:antitoxin StbD